MTVNRHFEVRLNIPVRFLVTGDTHLGRSRMVLPRQLVSDAARSDFIIHTGDFTTTEAFYLFREMGELLAVCGNNDDPELYQRLPDHLSILAGRTRIEVVHGHLQRGGSARDRALSRFTDSGADLVVFGHSHQAMCETVEGTLFLNPGSPTRKRRAPQFSYAVVEIDEDRINANLVYFEQGIA